jgi:hypothetical protein
MNSKPLIRTLRRRGWLSIGNLQITYEWLYREDGDDCVMLVVSDPAKPFPRRLRPVYMSPGETASIADGISVAIHSKRKPQPCSVQLAVWAPGKPITPGRLFERNLA